MKRILVHYRSQLLRYGPELMAVCVAGVSLAGALLIGLRAQPELPAARIASAERGRHLFVQSCAHCHGNDARGSGEDGDGPDLARLAIGNARIASVISSGIPEEMPSFAKKHGAADLADLIAYLRTVR